MRHKIFDSCMVFFPLIAACIIAFIVQQDNPLFTYWAIAMTFWVSSNTHGIMTYVKILWNAESRDKYYHFVSWAPLSLLIFSCVLWAIFGASSVISLYFYSVIFHYVRQSYGIGTIYKRASGSSTPNWLNQLVFYLFPLFALVLSMNEGFYFFGYEVYTLKTGSITPAVLFFMVAVSYAIWLCYQAYDFFKGQFSVFYFLSIIAHIIIFYVGFMLFDKLMNGWVCMAFWHSSQYILFMWHHLTGLSNKKNDGDYEFFKMITKNIYVFIIFSFIMAGAIMYAIYIMLGNTVLWAVPLFFVITVALNFNHYIMDALIWRRPKKQKVSV